VKTLAEQPGLVSVYLSVEKSGVAVDYLNEGNFTIYENDVALGKEVGLRLLSRDQYVDGHTILLLDVSGAPEAEYLKRLTRGASHFVEKVSTTQGVTVAIFDGSPKIKRIGAFPRVPTPTERPVPDLAQFASADPSRDLNGSLIAAVKVISEELSHSAKPVKVGTLVVLSRGADLAGRKSDDDVQAALTGGRLDRFLLVPDAVDFSTKGLLSSNGAVTYKSLDELPIRLSELGMKVRKSWGKYYFVAYCSPARAGSRTLKIELKFDDTDGDPVVSSVETNFTADGFSGGCAVPRSKAAEEPLVATVQPSEAATAVPIANDQPPPPKKPRPVKKLSEPPAPTATPPAPDEKVVAPKSGKYD
jgi:hypothetical protein